PYDLGEALRLRGISGRGECSRENLRGARETGIGEQRRAPVDLPAQPAARVAADAVELAGLRAEPEAVGGHGGKNSIFHRSAPVRAPRPAFLGYNVSLLFRLTCSAVSKAGSRSPRPRLATSTEPRPDRYASMSDGARNRT